MNERIRQLAEQAGLEMCSCGCDMPTRQSAKFAELIVQECAEVASNEVMDVEGNDWGVRRAVKQHFGVEE